ncbi:MAG: acyl carrier protein [Ruminococcaceae bacterium]|nr:acyl carrier protein [Oscillospiraceae bacterium]
MYDKNTYSGGEFKVTERVKELIAEQLGLQPEDIRPECSLQDDLGADSLDLVELLMAFSDEFGIEIEDEEAEEIVTVGDIIDALKEHE